MNYPDRYISNLELIPYHSSGLTSPSKFDTLQLDYVNQRLQSNIRFARKYNPSLFMFNGNAWYVLLIKYGFVQNYAKFKVTEKFNTYFFEIEGIPSILFDKFFQRHFWGLTDHHRAVIVPEIIKKKFNNIFEDE